MQQNEPPEAIFLIASGTVDITRTDANGTRVLLRASPADSIAAMPMILGQTALFTATAMTPVTAYRLDQASIAAVMRIRPELSKSLEAQARRGSAWIRCETEANLETPAADPTCCSLGCAISCNGSTSDLRSPFNENARRLRIA